MLRLGAPLLGRTLATALGLSLLSGCGPTATRVPASFKSEVGASDPRPLDESLRSAARRIEDSDIVPVSFPISPLPPVEEEEDAVIEYETEKYIADPEPREIGPLPAGPALSSDAGIDVDDQAREELRPEARPTEDLESTRSTSTHKLPSPNEWGTLSPKFASAYAVQPHRLGGMNDEVEELWGPSEPTADLVAVARQADTHIARGFKSAERGAIFTARAEFVHALRLSAAALDAQRQTAAHSRALTAGLRALDEAHDFLPTRTAFGQPVSVSVVAAGHQTPVLQAQSLDAVTPPEAIQRYLTYAQEQLASAGGDLQPAASALYALGKLDMTARAINVGSLESARAVVYFQAALVVHPRHALAANELGVLLARHGRLSQAKAALLHSVKIEPQPAAWRNLAIVHHHLGESDLARRADWEGRQSAQRQQASALAGVKAPAVEWLAPDAFARSNPFHAEAPAVVSGATTPAAGSAATAGKGNEKSTASKNASRWAPWLGGKR